MSKLSWIEKLTINCIDEEDGTMSIQIDWDENDPDLAEWTSWGPEGQEAFILDALRTACASVLGEDLTEPVDLSSSSS
jgi:hypothetical protein